MFFPLTDEFIFNLKYKIHTIQRGWPRYLRYILISNLRNWVQTV
jgi:hypothetical protein